MAAVLPSAVEEVTETVAAVQIGGSKQEKGGGPRGAHKRGGGSRGRATGRPCGSVMCPEKCTKVLYALYRKSLYLF